MIKRLAELAGALIGVGLYLFLGDLNRKGGRQASRIEFVQILISDYKIKGVIRMAELKEGQKMKLTVAPKTSRGHAASIEAGSGRWTSSDDGVVSVEQNPDNELEATIHGLDGSANESVVIEFRGDADRSAEGVREIIGTLDVVCTTGDAAVVDISAGTPEDDSTPATTGTGTGTAPAENPGNVPADTSTDSTSETPTTEGTDNIPPNNG